MEGFMISENVTYNTRLKFILPLMSIIKTFAIDMLVLQAMF
jgi:hypothetical protein